MRGHFGREEDSLGKDPIRLWIEKGLEVGNLWMVDKSVISNISDLTLPSNDRHWFAGTAPLLPITEPSATRVGVSTVLTRVLIAAVVEKDSTASTALLERAHQLCASSLREKSASFDVVELATVLSEDDDELIVALDAILRLADGIRSCSPLHPTRLVLQILTANAFDERALTELLFDDDSGARAAFPMTRRLFEWAREERVAIREAARAWHPRHIAAGGWREVVDGEEEKEESSSGSSSEEEVDDEEMEQEMEEEEEYGSREVVDSSAPFLIRVVQMAGQREEEKTFLLPNEEEPRRLVRPTRLECDPTDAWPQLLQMSRRLSQALQRQAKLRGSNFRKECRELVEIIDRFLKEAEEE